MEHSEQQPSAGKGSDPVLPIPNKISRESSLQLETLAAAASSAERSPFIINNPGLFMGSGLSLGLSTGSPSKQPQIVSGSAPSPLSIGGFRGAIPSGIVSAAQVPSPLLGSAKSPTVSSTGSFNLQRPSTVSSLTELNSHQPLHLVAPFLASQNPFAIGTSFTATGDEDQARLLLGLAGRKEIGSEGTKTRAPTTGRTRRKSTIAEAKAGQDAVVVDKAALGKRARAKASAYRAEPSIKDTPKSQRVPATASSSSTSGQSSATSAARLLLSVNHQNPGTSIDPHTHVIVPEQPEIISVVKRKGTVIVQKWGSAPLAIERTIRGTAFIPHGFEVETISDRKTWVGQTKVLPEADYALQYRFYLKSDPSKCGGWHKNASKAYRDAYSSLDNVEKAQLDHLKSSNGRLIIGVTYGNLQERIRVIFQKEVMELENLLRFTEDPIGKPILKRNVSGASAKRPISSGSSSANKKLKATSASLSTQGGASQSSSDVLADDDHDDMGGTPSASAIPDPRSVLKANAAQLEAAGITMDDVAKGKATANQLVAALSSLSTDVPTTTKETTTPMMSSSSSKTAEATPSSDFAPQLVVASMDLQDNAGAEYESTLGPTFVENDALILFEERI